MVAPIALYPDSLLAQTLAASTYPLEIVQAERWAKKNKDLKGDALAKALEKEGWDPSVKSLVNFPQVLQMMNEKLLAEGYAPGAEERDAPQDGRQHVEGLEPGHHHRGPGAPGEGLEDAPAGDGGGVAGGEEALDAGLLHLRHHLHGRPAGD